MLSSILYITPSPLQSSSSDHFHNHGEDCALHARLNPNNATRLAFNWLNATRSGIQLLNDSDMFHVDCCLQNRTSCYTNFSIYLLHEITLERTSAFSPCSLAKKSKAFHFELKNNSHPVTSTPFIFGLLAVQFCLPNWPFLETCVCCLDVFIILVGTNWLPLFTVQYSYSFFSICSRLWNLLPMIVSPFHPIISSSNPSLTSFNTITVQ